MEFNYLTWETRQKALKNGDEVNIGLLTIDSAPVNALSSKILDELNQAFDQIPNEDVVGVVITGAGKAFIAGADVTEMQDMDKAEAKKFSEKGQTVFNKLADLSVPTVAAVNGFCLGGGLELALACTVRFFSEKAVAGLPEVTLGLLPGFGGTQRFTRLAGAGAANYYILSGRQFIAEKARELGIAQEVCSAEDLIDESLDYLSEVAQAGPAAIAVTRDLIQASFDRPFLEGLEKESEKFSELFKTEQPKEGITAFKEKRAPKFR